MKRLEHKHPRPVRWMHWINVPLLAGMIWSGLLIYWANDVYRVDVGNTTLFHFFPNWFYDAFGLGHRLAEGLAWHFAIIQQFAYSGVVLMGLGSLLTGLAIYKPTQLAWLTDVLGGYEWARWEHFCLTVGYVAFFLVHITQVVRAGWNNFRAMVTGYEVVPVEEVTHG